MEHEATDGSDGIASSSSQGAQHFKLKNSSQNSNCHGEITKMREKHETFFSGVDSLSKFGKDLSKFSRFSENIHRDGHMDILSNKSCIEHAFEQVVQAI